MSPKKCSRLGPLLESTKLCKFHAEGKCKRGEACTFAHSSEQILDPPDLSKTRLCVAFKRSGFCARGADCNFAHGKDDRQLRVGVRVLSANRGPSEPPQIFGAAGMDSRAQEQAVIAQIPEIARVVEQGDGWFVDEGSARATSERSSSADGSRRSDRRRSSQASSTQETYGFVVKNTFIEFADEEPGPRSRSSSLPAHLGRGWRNH
eukprot:TRINITY_DN10149_c0_g1_i1.p1 TRINITY_DN10149_c0_g1~~TRINITY_DN10149_c0_g1_i1.p1  ORF type:complete len:206 (-),score=25.99 TRINITY_DN10149_c0_g1_i1:80-697(-)